MTTPPTDRQYVKITVTGECDHVLGTYIDTIEEKYPFWCGECDDDRRMGKWPWKLTTEIITPFTPAQAPVSENARP